MKELRNEFFSRYNINLQKERITIYHVLTGCKTLNEKILSQTEISKWGTTASSALISSTTFSGDKRKPPLNEFHFIESFKESEHVYTFLFEKEKDLTWKAGQHGLFRIIHKKIKNHTRPFSVASAPDENLVQITMRISEEPSDFKKAMLELKQGMTVSMAGPVGSFYLKDNRPAILIAGGIGITPFRSIIKQIEANGNRIEKPIHLLYMDSQESYLFKNDLDGIVKNTSINVVYLNSRDNLHQEIDKYISLYENDGKYYIAGPKSMADSISSYLQKNKISKKNIKKDAFFGS